MISENPKKKATSSLLRRTDWRAPQARFACLRQAGSSE